MAELHVTAVHKKKGESLRDILLKLMLVDLESVQLFIDILNSGDRQRYILPETRKGVAVSYAPAV